MPFRLFAARFTLACCVLAAGCRAQTAPAAGASSLSPELARRIALTIRSKAGLPFNYEVKVSERKPSPVAGYDEVTVMLGEAGKPARPMAFLISNDNATLAQMNTFDLARDPRTLVSDAGRPARGGTGKAPVTIVVYDDLECPFCAKMHAQMFPAILARYGDNVRIAYKDFPLAQIHPWAVHAAVNADCLAAQKPATFWTYVDYMHAHLDEIGLDPTAPKDKESSKTLPVALQQVDRAALDLGAKDKLDVSRLSACIQKQDETAVRTSMKEGDALNVSGVPALFINGESITGAVPIEYVYRAVDDAMTAEGVTPPAAVPLPSLTPAAPGNSAGK